MADLRHLRFYGSNNGFFENPVYDLSSIETIALNCSVFEKIAFFNLATDRQTNRWTAPIHGAALAGGGLINRLLCANSVVG